MLSIVFAFASCKKDSIKNQQGNSTTSTTEQEITKPTETTTGVERKSLIGTWIYDETVTPQNFYTDFYDPEITQTNIKLRTTYEFNSDGTFSTTVSIINISAVRVEYRSLMVAVGRKNLESQGKILTPNDVLYYENYADEILKEICTEQQGTYAVDGNKITYTTDDGSFYEIFALNNNKLTLTGSSASDDGYSVTLIRNTQD